MKDLIKRTHGASGLLRCWEPVSVVVVADDTIKAPWGSCNRGFAKLPKTGVFAMKILSKRQLKELVLYSPQHIARLEAAGNFPKRVKLGANRVGWVESEVLDWLQVRLDRREDTT